MACICIYTSIMNKRKKEKKVYHTEITYLYIYLFILQNWKMR